MSIFTVREYVNVATDANGNPLPVGLEPALTTQVKTTSGANQDLAAFQPETRYIEISCNGIVNWVINGTAAVGAAGRLPADVSKFYGVQSGGRDDAGNRTPLVISVIDDT